jgi:hypothetical protein
MTGGSITGNKADLVETWLGSPSGDGGGVYVYDGGSFTMSGGVISGNTAAVNGGGVFNDGTLTVSGTAAIHGNTKLNGTTDNLYPPVP